METLTNSYTAPGVNYVNEKTTKRFAFGNWYNDLAEKLTFSHFGVISMAILIGSCLGSICAMYLFMAGAPTWIFAIGLFASVGNLVACVAQASTKWVLNMFVLSVVVNLALLAYSFI
jgi:hypothetical protein